MYRIFSILWLLPILEIVGFITIGGKIGLVKSLLWLAGAAWLGFFLLEKRGRSAFTRAQKAQGDEIFMVQDLFDGFCIFIASVLLIFPGFISDFIAALLVIAPLRRKIFDGIKANPTHPARKFTRVTKKTETVIEGEFSEMDENK